MSSTFLQARPNLKKIQVYSPTKANRETYAKEISEKYRLEVIPMSHPRDVYKGAHIVAGCTRLGGADRHRQVAGRGNSCHLRRRQAGRRYVETYRRARCGLGTAPAPWGLPQFAVDDEYITYAAKPKGNAGFQMKRAGKRGHGVIGEERAVFFCGDP